MVVARVWIGKEAMDSRQKEDQMLIWEHLVFAVSLESGDLRFLIDCRVRVLQVSGA